MTVNIDAAPPEGDYYVTVRHAGRVGFLLGPYDDLREALSVKRRAINLARDADPDAHWYAYGTSRAARGTTIKTVFGR